MAPRGTARHRECLLLRWLLSPCSDSMDPMSADCGRQTRNRCAEAYILVWPCPFCLAWRKEWEGVLLTGSAGESRSCQTGTGTGQSRAWPSCRRRCERELDDGEHHDVSNLKPRQRRESEKEDSEGGGCQNRNARTENNHEMAIPAEAVRNAGTLQASASAQPTDPNAPPRLNPPGCHARHPFDRMGIALNI